MASSPQPPTPALKRLFSATVHVAAPLSLGASASGERRIINITGGHFEGEALRGDILPGGADWQRVRPDGAVVLEARYTLRTHDGALIEVLNRGIRHGPAEVLARIAQGDIVDPALYYFRSAPAFETTAPQLLWLNNIIAICSAARTREAVLLDFYQVQ